jgi:hypothetical protein
VVVKHGEEFFVVDIAQASTRLVLAEKTQMGEELAETNIGREVDDLCQNGQGLALSRWDHTSSPMVFSEP